MHHSTRRRLGTGLAFAAALTAVAGLSATSADAAVAPIRFAAAVYYPTGQFGDSPSVDENGTAVGDFNGDGKPDIVAVDQAWGNTINIQYNKGNGTFASPGQVITLTGTALAENVVVGKFSGTGRDDIVVLTSYGFLLERNNGNGTFTQGPLTVLEQAPFQDSAVVTDINHDGRPDLIIKTVTGVQVEYGNGDGTFTAGPLTTIPGSIPPGISAITLANINGDGQPDLFAADAASQAVFALTGNPDGTFTSTVAGYAPFVPGSVAATDDTANGLDSVVAGTEFTAPTNTAALFVNRGNGTWGSPSYYFGGFNPVSATSGDFNGDGHTDVVLSDTTGNEQVVLGADGNGSLVSEPSLPDETFPQAPVVADLNGDGKPDLAVTAICPPPLAFIGESCTAVFINKS